MSDSLIGAVLGSIVAFVLSALFTIWREHSIRKSTKRDLYLDEIEKWTFEVMSFPSGYFVNVDKYHLLLLQGKQFILAKNGYPEIKTEIKKITDILEIVDNAFTFSQDEVDEIKDSGNIILSFIPGLRIK